ncbi:MAG: four-carbon acid sugar kinase family protein [Candidatus Melainabacteria bacterium]
MQVAGLNIGILADDMTGANDTALAFFMAGSPTTVIPDVSLLASGRAEESVQGTFSVNTQSRHLLASQAEQQVRQAVKRLTSTFGVELFYKKMDSTLRGNVVAECLTLINVLGFDCAVIVPAYPSQGRLTVGGYQLVDGVPVERTAVARDPLFPVRSSHIPTLLRQALAEYGENDDQVGFIPLSTVLHGAGPILKELTDRVEEGRKLVVVDATSDEDLAQIALAINKMPDPIRVLPCGSAGLAGVLAESWCPDKDDEAGDAPELAMTASPLLIISGSITPLSRRQIRELAEHFSYYARGTELVMVELSPEKLIGVESVDRDIQRIREALRAGNSVVLGSALQKDRYMQTLAVAKEHDIPATAVPHKVQAVMAHMAAEVMEGLPMDQEDPRLVLIGGETTYEVCQALECGRLTLVAEVEPAIPLLRDTQGRWLVTKSGNFGTPMTLAHILEFFRKHEQQPVS